MRAIWESVVPDKNEGDDGCSNAVAREAAPSSATDGTDVDIAQRMPSGAVNLKQVASAMGRGPTQNDDGESAHRLEDDATVNGDRRVTDAPRYQKKAPDATRSE